MTHTISGVPSKYDLIKEDALANIERLFILWGLKFIKISPEEYDFLNPTRIDKNFGAVRFNVKKGFGADFANVAFDEGDFNAVGKGFDRSDFGLSKNNNVRYGFDIIGLCQRVNKVSTYRESAKLLSDQLKTLDRVSPIVKADLDAHYNRKTKIEEEINKKITYAYKLLMYCKDFRGTLGEIYLQSRGIYLKGNYSTIRFHSQIYDSETKKTFPCLVFPIQTEPLGTVKGIHRIYLDHDGMHKAPIEEPKKALGEAKGNAIWFGEPGDTLYIVEGPENALTLMVCGATFVCSTIFSSNFSELTIPKYVKKLVLCPDPDASGMRALDKAKKNYYMRRISVKMPKKVFLPNGKLADFNDILAGAVKHE